MSVVDKTPTFKLNLPTFDLRVWHTYVNENFNIIDAVLQHYLDIENVVGVWRNGTEYHMGERAVDAENGAIYECLLDNVSAPVPTTFAQDRASNPSYWGGFTVKEEFKGTWHNSTPYSVQDFVVSGNIYAVCLTSHTSIAAPGVFGDDAVYWIYLINLTGNVLPNITGHGGSYVRAKVDESATEYRTPTQMMTDLGALPIAGGILTGNLTVGGGNLSINGPAGSNRNFISTTNNVNRWVLQFGNATAESGSNAGSDFSLARYTDAGVPIDFPLVINRASGAVTLAGGININGALTSGPGSGYGLALSPPVGHPALITLNAPTTGQGEMISGMVNGVPRWQMYLGDYTAEGGSNLGSDLSIFRWSDAGAYLGTALSISRADGHVTIPGGIFLDNTVASGSRYIIGRSSGSTRWVMNLPNGTAETGGNAGSDFSLDAYNDVSGGLGTPLVIKRSNLVATFAVAIVNGVSDRSLKDNIKPLKNSLDKVLKLQGVSFNFKSTPKKPEIGLIAQDVAEIVPEIIQDYDMPGLDGAKAEVKLALDYPRLVAVLIEAVKELTERVNILEAQR